MGSKKNVDMSIKPEELEDKKTKKTAKKEAAADAQEPEATEAKKPVQKHERSAKYKTVRAFVDRTKKIWP